MRLGQRKRDEVFFPNTLLPALVSVRRVLQLAAKSANTQPGHDAPEHYAGVLRRYFLKRAHPSEVDDLVQIVMMRMHSRQSETPIENVGGYIFTVAANVLRESRSGAASRTIHVELEPADLIDTITPERLVMGRRDVDLIVEAIEQLPERTRRIFVSHRFEDRTYAALAREHGISVSAIEKHIAQALRALSQVLGRTR